MPGGAASSHCLGVSGSRRNRVATKYALQRIRRGLFGLRGGFERRGDSRLLLWTPASRRATLLVVDGRRRTRVLLGAALHRRRAGLGAMKRETSAQMERRETSGKTALRRRSPRIYPTYCRRTGTIEIRTCVKEHHRAYALIAPALGLRVRRIFCGPTHR